MIKARVLMVALIFGLTQWAAPVAADSFAEAISDCRKINNKERRYQCYDAAESAAASVRREVGNFNYQAKSDPVSGQTIHTLSIRSSRGLNSRREPIILELTCDSTRPGEYNLRLHWGNFLESSEPEVTTRIGDQPAVTGTWETDRRRETAILPGKKSGYTKQQLIETLVDEIAAGNSNVVFRTKPYNAEPITAVFNFTGFLEVVEPMRNSCRF